MLCHFVLRRFIPHKFTLITKNDKKNNTKNVQFSKLFEMQCERTVNAR